jgi:hypothetical protein
MRKSKKEGRTGACGIREPEVRVRLLRRTGGSILWLVFFKKPYDFGEILAAKKVNADALGPDCWNTRGSPL